MPLRPLSQLVTALLVCAPFTSVAQSVELMPATYHDVAAGPVLNGGLGLSNVGDDLVGDLGAQCDGLRSIGSWLISWNALVAFRGGVLANTNPYTSFLGGTGRGYGEAGYRFSNAPVAGYVSGRLAANLSVMGHPGLAISAMNTLNNADGFGGVNFEGAVRVSGGVSMLSSGSSGLVTGFVQEAGFAAGVYTPGRTFTEVGVGGRYDLFRSFTIWVDAMVGFRPLQVDSALQSTDAQTRVHLAGGLRKRFGNGVWFGFSASGIHDTDHVVYTQTRTTYETTNPWTTTVTLSFGVELWRTP
jgi:hypothetical protein